MPERGHSGSDLAMKQQRRLLPLAHIKCDCKIRPLIAERNGGRVLALVERDFGVVAREGTIAVLPT
jgi:hypothetical protein